MSCALCILGSSLACRPVYAPGYRVGQRATKRAPSGLDTKAHPVAAQGSALAAPSGDQRAWIVFDRSLDPTTVRAFNFILVYADDSRSYPSAVHLAGADIGVDARSLVVEGEFLDDAEKWRLVRIQIVGPVYAQDGSPLRGTSVVVTPPQAPRAIAARRFDAESGSCPGGAVRIYFSDGVEVPATAPVGPNAYQSNRHDLCSSPSGPLLVPPGLVHGGGGEANLEATLDVERPS